VSRQEAKKSSHQQQTQQSANARTTDTAHTQIKTKALHSATAFPLPYAPPRKGEGNKCGPAIAPCMGNGVRRDEAALRLFPPHPRKGEGNHRGKGEGNSGRSAFARQSTGQRA
jgi:hypothetical protein